MANELKKEQQLYHGDVLPSKQPINTKVCLTKKSDSITTVENSNKLEQEPEYIMLKEQRISLFSIDYSEVQIGLITEEGDYINSQYEEISDYNLIRSSISSLCPISKKRYLASNLVDNISMLCAIVGWMAFIPIIMSIDTGLVEAIIGEFIFIILSTIVWGSHDRFGQKKFAKIIRMYKNSNYKKENIVLEKIPGEDIFSDSVIIWTTSYGIDKIFKNLLSDDFIQEKFIKDSIYKIELVNCPVNIVKKWKNKFPFVEMSGPIVIFAM